ncbi:hypothetical protein OHS81_14005 [Streptomyces sp. NBC_00400]|uniref:hypothetical protein n=1 Tax=Streptomyces sp. NBC_00400 TaxID=2975737 RepID=UPI002E1D3333
MQLQFIGVDPNSDIDESPTAWVDLENADIVIQSYTADDATRAQCVQNNAPGHAQLVPDHESVIRVPARLVPILREACDAAERAKL